jgi:hypothetical protein
MRNLSVENEVALVRLFLSFKSPSECVSKQAGSCSPGRQIAYRTRCDGDKTERRACPQSIVFVKSKAKI